MACDSARAAGRSHAQSPGDADVAGAVVLDRKSLALVVQVRSSDKQTHRVAKRHLYLRPGQAGKNEEYAKPLSPSDFRLRARQALSRSVDAGLLGNPRASQPNYAAVPP